MPEGTNLVYTVTLTNPSSTPVTYPFNLGGGTAAPGDIGAPVFSNGVTLNPNGTITVPAGVTSFTVTVPTIDDTTDEPNETVPLTIGGVTGTGTIIDNDEPPVLKIISVSDASAIEGNTLIHTVTLILRQLQRPVILTQLAILRLQGLISAPAQHSATVSLTMQ